MTDQVFTGDDVVVDIWSSGGVRLSFGTRPADILSTISNLSSDEVFTPPQLANRMLDNLEAAWAVDNDGEIIWSRPDVRFLDPATKSGVFLREIAKRLIEHQGNPPENSHERRALVDRILTTQVYGIGTTTLTSLLARRSVYCTKTATGRHSVAPSFDRDWGNIWFERMEHDWSSGTPQRLADPVDASQEALVYPACKRCGARRTLMVKGVERRFDDLSMETHAYAFIHSDAPQELVADMFGEKMQFDVIIGNPPYQMTGAGGGTQDAPIYHKFVESALSMEPRYLTMVIQSRWMVAGRALDDFRARMLKDRRVQILVDYPSSLEAFPGVDIAGGIQYFLWNREYDGATSVTTMRDGHAESSTRALDEFDIFVRDAAAVAILHKVRARDEASIMGIMAGDTPFGIPTNYEGFHATQRDGDVPLHYNRRGKRLVGYVARSGIAKNAHLVDLWKVLIPEAGFEHAGGDGRGLRVLSKPLIVEGPSVCTQTYLFFWCESEAEAASIQSYLTTRLFRFLVSLRKTTQHTSRSTYAWVPQQTWDRIWTDQELYAKYGLDDDEVAFIESVIKPMSIED